MEKKTRPFCLICCCFMYEGLLKFVVLPWCRCYTLFVFPLSQVPVYPMVHSSPPLPATLPKPKPPVAPADDIQLPPVGYSRKTPPNGYWTPPPKYEDIFARRPKPPASPPSNQVILLFEAVSRSLLRLNFCEEASREKQK